MRLPKTALFLTFLLAVFSVGNIYIFFHRANGFNNTFYSYSNLYYPNHLPRIKGFELISKDQLKIILVDMASSKWEILSNGKREYSTGPHPTIRLSESDNTYLVTSAHNAGVAPLTFKIQYTPSEKYLSSGLTSADSYNLTFSSIPIDNFTSFPIETFAPSSSDYPQEDVELAHKLRNVIGIRDNDSTETNIEKLGNYILTHLNHMGGVPTNALVKLSPFQQFQLAKNGGSPVWCTNFAEIYTFFANVYGIPTRIVEASGSLNQVNLSGHAFCESYIKEQERWAFVDLCSRKVFVKNSEGEFLNTIDLFYLNQLKSFDGVVARYYADHEFSTIPYPEAEQNSESFYFNKNVIFKFYRPQITSNTLIAKITRYLLDPAFCYSLQTDNTKNYIKKTFLWGQLSLIIALSLTLLFKKNETR